MNFIDFTGLAKIIYSRAPGRNLLLDGPRYGNWGGGRWSGGVAGGGVGSAPPVDSADSCLKKHDNAYGACDRSFPYGSTAHKACMKAADKALAADLGALPADPRRWPSPPTPGTEKDADGYRDGAQGWFD